MAALTARHLGELLYRAARVRSVEVTAVGDGITYESSDRPYPSTAGLYELELYLSLDRCEGLPRGSYHYDPLGHSLTLVNSADDQLAETLDCTAATAGLSRRPAALITVTSRIARLSWMYSGSPYATTLKHVGLLQQTVRLVARAMGLSPLVIASGDNDHDAAHDAFALVWPDEVSVGEIVVNPA